MSARLIRNIINYMSAEYQRRQRYLNYVLILNKVVYHQAFKSKTLNCVILVNIPVWFI